MKRSSWHAFLSGLRLSLLSARFHLLLFFSILFPPITQLSSINMKRCIYCIEYLGFCYLRIRFLIRFYTHYKAATIATTLGFSLNPRFAVVNHSKVIPFKIPTIGRELQEPFPLITVNTPWKESRKIREIVSQRLTTKSGSNLVFKSFNPFKTWILKVLFFWLNCGLRLCFTSLIKRDIFFEQNERMVPYILILWSAIVKLNMTKINTPVTFANDRLMNRKARLKTLFAQTHGYE